MALWSVGVGRLRPDGALCWQLNVALYRIVQTRLRDDPRTQDYDERRIKERKTRREIIRCLKRYAAREVFNLVRPSPSSPRA
ncbi:hypothetical protein ACFW1M_28895 [Streptomyces inhibens]|uniref:hypothetical protein n=1 Tax=Streptomyces inhibens TaxID=2293571 RepID=UPI0036899DEB